MKDDKTTLKRRVSASLNRQELCHPLDFLIPKRLDIAAKTIFARAYLEKNTSKWPEEVYREHIRSLNNFYEKEPQKNSYEDFRNSFIETIEGVKDRDNWKHRKPVPVNGSFLMNGAHRVAVSIALKDKINVIRPDDVYTANWGFEYFRSPKNINWDGDKTVLREDILDAMTIEYVSLKRSRIFVAIVFPAAKGRREEVYDHLSELGEIVNMKSFKYNEFNGVEVIKQLYCDGPNDEWNTGMQFDSTLNKARPCFDGKGDLQVYVIESNMDETTRIKEKQYLRELWNVDKHSIHITDTIEEANRVVRMFFNENSRRFLKINRTQEFNSEKMFNLFNEYIKLAPKNILTREKVAIEGSAILDLFNLRDGQDIDYISRSSQLRFGGVDIERHSDDDAIFHSVSIDEILTNPNYHFYYKGYKFVDILELKKYKERRYIDGRYGEIRRKDLEDIKLINDFLRKNPQYGFADKKMKNDNPLISVIVSAYNVESFLVRCIESVVYQDYKNLEIIIVIDGSPDNSLQIATRYAELDSRIKIVNLESNSGLFAARMAGFSEMSGEYFLTVDGDDTIKDNFIGRLLASAQQTKADIVTTKGYTRSFIDGSQFEILNGDIYSKTDKSFIEKASEGGYGWEIWSKLYKKDIFDKSKKNLRKITEKVNLGEDILFAVAFTNSARQIHCLTDEFGYLYSMNDKSITNVMTVESVSNKIATIDYVIKCVGEFLLGDNKSLETIKYLEDFKRKQFHWIIKEYDNAKMIEKDLDKERVAEIVRDTPMGVKQATKKLAGAVKRKAYRTLNSSREKQ